MCSMCYSDPCHPSCPNAEGPKVMEKCIHCGEEIYEGDEYYDVDGEPWCEKCMDKCKKEA